MEKSIKTLLTFFHMLDYLKPIIHRVNIDIYVEPDVTTVANVLI